MSVSYMTPTGPSVVPSGAGGGISIEALKRIEVLEKELSDLKKTIATTDKYGLSKITRAMDVTGTGSGLVLGAEEKNPAVTGSLANKISLVDSKFETYYSLRGGQNIPGGSDLNTYMNVGNYFCTGNDIAESILNCPIAHAFTMKVELGSGLAYPIQTIRDFITGDIYFRMRDERQWNRWRKSTFTEI